MADAPRKRRWPWFLGIGLGLLAAAALWVHHQRDPERLARRVLDAVGESQGLEITFEGKPDYALRPEPRLVLPGVVVRRPGVAAPLLTADRAEVALPWDTVLGEGPVVITYVELDAPALDLPAFNDWRASRPPAPDSEIPTISRGVRVAQGSVQGDGWRASELDLALGPVAPGQAAELEYSGRLTTGDFSFTSSGRLSIASLGDTSEFRVETTGGIPLEDRPVDYELQARCTYDRKPPRLELRCGQVAWSAAPPLPTLEISQLYVQYGGTEMPLELRAEGTMPAWPEGWPTLPQPPGAGSSDAATRFTLTYAGAADLADPVALDAQRGDTKLQATGRWAALQAWLAQEPRSALPPLTGRFSTPALVVEGFTLEGVQLELNEKASEEE